MFRPELFSSRIFVDRIRLDEDKSEKCSSVSSGALEDLSYFRVVTEMSEVGDSVVCVRSISLFSSSLAFRSSGLLLRFSLNSLYPGAGSVSAAFSSNVVVSGTATVVDAYDGLVLLVK